MKRSQPIPSPAASAAPAWIETRLTDFDHTSLIEKLGQLAIGTAVAGFVRQYTDQTMAWQVELDLLGTVVRELLAREPASGAWTLLLEYTIPRRQRRIDAVLLADRVVCVLEFKIGAATFARADAWQVEDYALDLRDFHGASHDLVIEPFLIATEAVTPPAEEAPVPGEAHRVGRTGLVDTILRVVHAARRREAATPINPLTWATASYSPARSIVEAARTLFNQQSIRELSHAYADNLAGTVQAIANAIGAARAAGRRAVCVVTGVPGSGKTLAGLAAVHDPSVNYGVDTTTAFMSGNGPLVRVLREALVRDAAPRLGGRRPATRKAELLVQSVHVFIEEYGVKRPSAAPHERVIVFDEAQRAWNAAKLQRRHVSLAASEAAVVLDIMRRPPEWAAIVAIIGGGQEIHEGEAGLEAWGQALEASPVEWDVVISPEALDGGASVAGHRLFPESPPAHVHIKAEPALHLSVSVRSPRAQYLAEWVNAVLTLDAPTARAALAKVTGYRLGLTRDLGMARRWLRDAARDDRRPGLLASSGSLRHRAYGLEMSPDFHRAYPIADWFLSSPVDVRSSWALEVAMTEFECQGLELDYVGVCWGDDLTVAPDGGHWTPREFKGARWLDVKASIKQQYLLNKYRVLLSRAREGMVIWVPPGDPEDPTRAPDQLDRTADFLRLTGLALVSDG